MFSSKSWLYSYLLTVSFAVFPPLISLANSSKSTFFSSLIKFSLSDLNSFTAKSASKLAELMYLTAFSDELRM